MTYADLFAKVKGMLVDADVSHVQEHLAYQFNITGEGEGIFYAEVKEGKLVMWSPYEYFDRDVIFTCSGETPAQESWKERKTRSWPLPSVS